MSNFIYEIITSVTGSKILKRTDEYGKEWFIPMNESIPDYQAYLRWLENPDEQQAALKDK